MIIPRKEALQARLEEVGLVWENRETLESLERRVSKLSLRLSTTAVIPEKARGVECFGFYYDENANQCSFNRECLLSGDCLQYTMIKFEDLVMNSGKPRKRMLDYDVI